MRLVTLLLHVLINILYYKLSPQRRLLNLTCLTANYGVLIRPINQAGIVYVVSPRGQNYIPLPTTMNYII